MPGGMQVYKFTSSRRFSIGATLISRTSLEATRNLKQLQTLRGWRMPYFGSSSTTTKAQKFARNDRVKTNQVSNTDTPLTPAQRNAAAKERASYGVELLGAPPDVLYLYAYSTSANDGRNIQHGVNINRVPVVLTSLDIAYPNDVDYLPTYANDTTGLNGALYDATSEPFPMKMDITISLMETHSPREYENFSLALFKQGKLTGF
jgi:hypothetical protein